MRKSNRFLVTRKLALILLAVLSGARTMKTQQALVSLTLAHLHTVSVWVTLAHITTVESKLMYVYRHKHTNMAE
jgi:hypothetical protein